MRLAVLASGSKGNAALIEEGEAKILIDAGLSERRLRAALKKIGVEPSEIDGIIVTHEHSDHVAGLAAAAQKWHCPVYAKAGTFSAMTVSLPPDLCRIIDGSFVLGGVKVEAFSTMHDAADSVGYRLTGKNVFVVATDLGFVTQSVAEAMEGADILLLESNHDEAMLKGGTYPWPLKRRILSNRGHLSNTDAAIAVTRMKRPPKKIVLAHLSENNNRPELALENMENILKKNGLVAEVSVAEAHEITECRCGEDI